MNKPLKLGIIAFVIFFMFSIIVYIFSINNNSKANQKDVTSIADNNSIEVDIDGLLGKGTWYDITEEDKITLAFAAETEIISTIKQYLQDNKIAIFFVYGGPFDHNLKGNYIICTGFNEDGKAKILYSDDNFETEWKYSFEGLIEFSSKVMLFDM